MANMKPTIVLIKVKRKDLLGYKLIHWSRSSISFHCYLAEFINLIILRVIVGLKKIQHFSNTKVKTIYLR
jgi:hypothetical protein|nr:MAG TPA: hypothetical protein [Crassvirales sp.]